MSSKINLQTCEYARKSSIFQDNQLISDKFKIFLNSHIPLCFSANLHKVFLLVILTISIWHYKEKSPHLNGRGDFSLLILPQKFLCNVQIPYIALDKGHHQIFHLSQSISAKDFCIGQTIPRMQICFLFWTQVTAQ